MRETDGVWLRRFAFDRFLSSSSSLCPLAPSPLTSASSDSSARESPSCRRDTGPVTEPRRLATWAGVPWATICPPSRPAAGPKSSSWSASGDHLAVVLDHQQRVAQVAELFQRVEQPAVVARVQADGRLVEHVEHAAQPAAHLGRQANPLHLAAGKRRGGPGERQILQAHVDQELQPVANLARHLAGNLPLGVREFPALELVQQPAQRHPAELVDRARLAEPHGRGIVAQPAAAADGTLDFVDQMFQLRAERRRQRGSPLPTPDRAPCIGSGKCETGELARSTSARASAPLVRLQHVEPLLARAVEDQPAVAAARVRRRARRCGMPVPRENASSIMREDAAAGARPQRHGALGERELRIAQQRGRIRAGLRAQALRRPDTSPRRC